MKIFSRDTEGMGDSTTSIGTIIMVVVGVVIALALTPIVTTSVSDAGNHTTGAAHTMVDLIPLMYIVGVLLLAIVWIVAEARKAKG